MRGVPSWLFVVATCVAVCGCKTTRTGSGQFPAQPRLLVALPEYCNTPDGMTLLPDQSIIVSVPNFNDESKPPLLIRIRPDNQVEKFYEFPTPYPGLPKGLDRIAPVGIAVAPDGNLYFADMQYLRDKNQKSRLWKLVVRDGRPEKLVLVASGFNCANGVAIRNGHVYVTESVLVEGSQPLQSAVLRFRLDEENVVLRQPLKEDPHILAVFRSYKAPWRFGANGIEFDAQGNLYVGVFGEGVIYKLNFDSDGRVISSTEFARSVFMTTCDGMHRDPRTGALYVADLAVNAVHEVSPEGHVRLIATNGDPKSGPDKLKGLLDGPCDALVRGDEIVVSNMDWPQAGFRNSKHQMPATLSVMRIPVTKPAPEPKKKRGWSWFPWLRK
ncbi:MAG: SMP-30/gluconolactonase/LRE family protein [Verrucomicrobiae bacterium]|nr:SMP-30/gluconolactonase/LRE family protein [Verrucomicrobiae bacterium]